MASHSLPLFPLPLVLFPGAALPLHIFEPRYRRLLADCRAGDGRFGIVLAGAGPETTLGRVGCVAELRDVHMLDDGRANILVEGRERFTLERVLESSAPYHVADVGPYEDSDDDDALALTVAADRARATFARVATAARTIADESAPVPELPTAPEQLAFRIASLVDFDRAAQQALLESRSPLARLLAVEQLLATALGGVEARAATHVRARSNGHGTSSTT